MIKNINDWTTVDVIIWLKTEIPLIQLDYDNIKKHEIDGRDLIDLTEDNLKYDLKIIKLHDIKLFMRKIADLIKIIIESYDNIKLNTPDKLNKSNNLSKTKINTTGTGNKEIILPKNIEIATNEVKQINLEYKKQIIKFKYSECNKFKDLLIEFTDILNLNADDKYIILDDQGLVIPKETFVNTISTNNETFRVIINNDPIRKERGVEKNTPTNNNSSSVTAFNENKTTFPIIKISDVSNKNYSLYNNKDFSIQETANKNRYLSFEALDNFEKNGYTFNLRKNMTNSVDNKTDKENFTINSYYNISNLNSFNNNPDLIKSQFPSLDNKNQNLSYVEPNNNYLQKLQKTQKISSLNIRSKKKIDFDDISNNNVYDEHAISTGNFIKIDDKSNEDSEQKLDVDSYMNKLISYKNSISSLHNQSCNSEQSKKLFDKKLRNYYVEANKIKSKFYFDNLNFN